MNWPKCYMLRCHPNKPFYQYGYSAQGWLTNRVDAKGVPTLYAYNNIGQLTGVVYATDAALSYTFDSLGRMTSRVDAAGTWAWTYDGGSSRVLSEKLSSASSVLSVVNYSYNSDTLDLASVASGSHTTLYAWAAGRLVAVTNLATSTPLVFNYSYVADSDLLETTTYLGGTVTVHRAWDAGDRLTNITSVSSVPSVVNGFAYSLDNLGRRVARQDKDASQIAWGYDKYDQLISASRTGAGGTNAAADLAYNFGYQYDEVGNRLHEDRGQLDLDGMFNPLNQLTRLDWQGKLDIVGTVGATSGVYVLVQGATSAPPFYGNSWLGGATLNPGSNTIPVVAWTNTPGATNTSVANLTVYMPPARPQKFLWDLNGNLTNDSMRAYYWNEENKLVAIEALPDIPGVPRKRSEFVFDAESRMTQRKDLSDWTNGAYATTNTTRYVRDGYRILSETQVSGLSTQVSYHVWGLDLSQTLDGAGGIGGLLARIEGTNQYLYTYCGNGNVQNILNSTGAVVASYTYDPFGKIVGQFGPYAASNPWRFSTKLCDPTWGILWYEFRPYSPNLHILLTRDPLEEQGSLRLYAFCANDPVSNIDPLGLAAYFFGGTGNNLTDKGWSNVEILYRAWNNDAGHGEKFYVPGVFSGYAPDGTPYSLLKGTTVGMLGEGISGDTLEERAEYMMGLLRTQLSKPNPDKEVNVYGFSRGSLTALVFLDKIAKEAKLNPKLFEGVYINQTVLFDTVSHADENLNCELPKNLTYTHQPLHLIAIDEQRKQFFDKEVLDVQGALQIGFRGVHANVGGGHNNNSLSREPLYFVNTMMKASGMNVFDLGVMDKYAKKYGMIGNDALSTPSKNDTWFYTMGHRDFPAGMFLSAGFMFRKSGLKNDVPDSLDYINNIDQEKWGQGQRYIPGKGWIK